MIAVLRIGHRAGRDERVTTHVGLVARAFGADKIILPDEGAAESLRKVVQKFGGPFGVEFESDWKKTVKAWSGAIVHLTMYGERLDDALPRVKKEKDILVVVGAEKVPAEMYGLATYNVSVGSQPHSEVAALAIVLDRLSGGAWAKKEFAGKIRVVPNKRGKTVVETKDS